MPSHLDNHLEKIINDINNLYSVVDIFDHSRLLPDLMGANMKTFIFSIWKYLHGDVGNCPIGRPDEHPAVGIYSTLCSLEQRVRGKQWH